MRVLRINGVAMICACVLVGCAKEPPTAQEIVRPVIAMKVSDAEAFTGRWFPGRAKATREANVAFEVSGRMVERPVLVGDLIEEGQLLARLDPRDFQNALNQANAALEQAKAYRDRIAEAAKTGAVSQQQLTDAEAARKIAEAEVQIREKALQDAQLRAPFAGTISSILLENFENVLAKQKIMRLLDTSRIEMIVDIPETLISLAPHVKQVQVRFDAFPGRQFPGAIKEVSNEANTVTRTYAVNLILDQPDDVKVLPGMAGAAAAEIELPGDLDTAGHEIAASAVVTDDRERSYVWVVDPDSGTVSQRDVELGRLTPRGIMVRGVRTGEWVAIAGVHSLREGQTVRIAETEGRD